MLGKTVQFLKEVSIELKKCDWPIKRDRTLPFMDRIRDLVDSTIVVIVCMLLLAGFIGGVDFLLSKMIQLILK
jgi:preprotein translocase subunit SecE